MLSIGLVVPAGLGWFRVVHAVSVSERLTHGSAH